MIAFKNAKRTRLRMDRYNTMNPWIPQNTLQQPVVTAYRISIFTGHLQGYRFILIKGVSYA
jgi:hypothetical protein